jgi:hypothetical protein
MSNRLKNYWRTRRADRLITGKEPFDVNLDQLEDPEGDAARQWNETGHGVDVSHGREAIANLDEIYVKSRPDKFVFILAGRWWQVEEIHLDEGCIYVKPFPDVPPPATWISPHGHEVSYQIAQKIKQLLLSDDVPQYLEQAEAYQVLATLRRRARAEGLTETPIQFQIHQNDSCEVVNYAGDRVNLLLSQLTSRIKKWPCEDVGYASFRVKFGSEPVGDFEQAFLDFLNQVIKEKLLEDKSLLAELTADYDDENSSKWSPWLPPKYRQQLLVTQLFDVESTSMWLKVVIS